MTWNGKYVLAVVNDYKECCFIDTSAVQLSSSRRNFTKRVASLQHSSNLHLMNQQYNAIFFSNVWKSEILCLVLGSSHFEFAFFCRFLLYLHKIYFLFSWLIFYYFYRKKKQYFQVQSYSISKQNSNRFITQDVF